MRSRFLDSEGVVIVTVVRYHFSNTLFAWEQYRCLGLVAIRSENSRGGRDFWVVKVR